MPFRDILWLIEVLPAAVLLFWLPGRVSTALRGAGMTRPNYRGDVIPVGAGVALALFAAPMLALHSLLHPGDQRICLLWEIALLAFGGLGWIDDRGGDSQFRGLRGHLRAAIVAHKITTGLIKAVGGLAVASLLAFLLERAAASRAVDTALIALSANALNLLDLRPGRAGGFFLICALPLLAVAALRSHPVIVPLGYVTAAAAVLWLRDRRAGLMLGDTGSNLLGASLGLAAAMLLPVGCKALIVALLVALHVVAERLSLSRVIERTPWLRALDRLTGLR